MAKSIILMGYMGAGKTTLGKVLAKKLERNFCDLDWYIEETTGKTIPEIFAESGEDGFRQIEQAKLHEVAQLPDMVIAVGGGTPCFFDNVDFMNENAITVYLHASVETLIDHIHISNTNRPLIAGKSDDELRDYINESLRKREPFYLKATHILNLQTITLQSQIDDYVEQIIKISNQ